MIGRTNDLITYISITIPLPQNLTPEAVEEYRNKILEPIIIEKKANERCYHKLLRTNGAEKKNILLELRKEQMIPLARIQTSLETNQPNRINIDIRPDFFSCEIYPDSTILETKKFLKSSNKNKINDKLMDFISIILLKNDKKLMERIVKYCKESRNRTNTREAVILSIMENLMGTNNNIEEIFFETIQKEIYDYLDFLYEIRIKIYKYVIETAFKIYSRITEFIESNAHIFTMPSYTEEGAVKLWELLYRNLDIIFLKPPLYTSALKITNAINKNIPCEDIKEEIKKIIIDNNRKETNYTFIANLINTDDLVKMKIKLDQAIIAAKIYDTIKNIKKYEKNNKKSKEIMKEKDIYTQIKDLVEEIEIMAENMELEYIKNEIAIVSQLIENKLKEQPYKLRQV
ncbi:MAG: hypothetical protein ACPLRZ_11590 [Thermovenabulum sp.]|uniref:hypothetical protein n=1 Tax=Thermovenabulum sp. TaxID=3100335 RepID=UPI003C7DA6CC